MPTSSCAARGRGPLPAALRRRGRRAARRAGRRPGRRRRRSAAGAPRGARADAPSCARRLRARTLAGSLVPVLCGAALRNVGVQPLLDAVVDLPALAARRPRRWSATDPQTGERLERRPRDPERRRPRWPSSCSAEAHGDLVFVRIYSGVDRLGDRAAEPAGAAARARRSRSCACTPSARAVLRARPAGRHRRGHRPQVHAAPGDTLCDPGAADPARAPGLPRAGHLDGRRAALDGRPRQAARRRSSGIAHEDPSFHEKRGREHRPVADLRDGRAAPRGRRCTASPASTASRPASASRASPTARPCARARAGRGRVERVLGGKEVFGAVEVAGRAAPRRRRASVEVACSDACRGLPARLPRRPCAQALREAAQVGPRFGFPLVHARDPRHAAASRARDWTPSSPSSRPRRMALRQAPWRTPRSTCSSP